MARKCKEKFSHGLFEFNRLAIGSSNFYANYVAACCFAFRPTVLVDNKKYFLN